MQIHPFGKNENELRINVPVEVTGYFYQCAYVSKH